MNRLNLTGGALVLLGAMLALPAGATGRHARQQDPDRMNEANSTAPWRHYDQHPPEIRGTNLDHAVADADDMLGIIQDMRTSAAAIPPQVSAATDTLTHIATLIDGINARHAGQPGAAPAPAAGQ